MHTHNFQNSNGGIISETILCPIPRLSSITMASVKKYLKDAKRAIEGNDPEDALEYVDEALEIDNGSYIAHLFRGKALQLLGRNDEAIREFREVIAIDSENINGWKGYFQAARSQNDYDLFREVVSKYLEVQISQGIGTAATINDIRKYLDDRDWKSDLDLQEKFYRSILPGTQLGETMGGEFGNPEERILKVISIVSRKQKDKLNRVIAQEKMKLPRILNSDQKKMLDNLIWSIKQEYDLIPLYDMFLSFSNDDTLRAEYKETLLKYKYDLLLVAPTKETLIQEVKNMIDDMIYLKTRSAFCWLLYFDWSDVQSITDIDKSNLMFYLKNFSNEGLAIMLYAYVMSDISPYVKSEFSNLKGYVMSEASQNPSGSNLESALLPEAEPDNEQSEEFQAQEACLLSEEVLSLMLKGFKKCQGIVLADRILCDYYIHLHEYVEASNKCQTAIKTLADLQRSYGLELKSSKEDLLCTLAIVYTYHEAPKNYPRALQLYDKLIATNPANLKALVGKGIILLEKNALLEARSVLLEANQIDPDNIEANIELCWCKVKLGEYTEGREGLLQAIKKLSSMDIRSRRMRSNIHYRVAESFLMLSNLSQDEVSEAFDHLIKSLKDYASNSNSYSSLGIIYKKYFNDKSRAEKCFYKAFELDVGEITAARFLVEDFAAENEWDVAEIICKRIVQSDRARRVLLHSGEKEDNSWPYRVLGSAALNQQNDSKALEWFQTALRMTSMDLQCWIGLGEAYYNCGRLDASIKVFSRVLAVDPSSWISKYFMGTALCEMHKYEEGIIYLNDALELRPNEECIFISLYSAKIQNTFAFIEGGFTGRALDCIAEALQVIFASVKVNWRSQCLWKALGDCLRVFITLKNRQDLLPMDQLVEVLSTLKEEILSNRYINESERDDAGLIGTESFADCLKLKGSIITIFKLLVLTSKAAISTLPIKSNRTLTAAAYFNLGLAYYEAFCYTSDKKYQSLSIVHLKKCIQLELNNASFWVTLANAYTFTDPQLAQHCYIKATSLEENDGEIWTNLAALYLRYGDTELAMQAFLRAQSVTPEKAKPWIGHALSSRALGNFDEASNYFTHAYVVANSRLPLVEFLYGYSVIDKRIRLDSSDPRDIETAQEFSIANFAMDSFSKFFPEDILGLKVGIVIAERCFDYERGLKMGERLCTILEKQYETTEDTAVLLDFARTKAQIARLQLGLENYEEAVNNAQITLGIIEEEEEEAAKSCILSTRVVIGLAFFLNDQFDEALDQFRLILSDYPNSSNLVCLTALVLNAFGSKETKEAALEQLFTFIQENGASLTVLFTLSAIALVDGLEDYFEPLLEQFKTLPLSTIASDTRRDVPKILSHITKRMQDLSLAYIWSRYAYLFPQDYKIWSNLTRHMALTVANLDETRITASELSNYYLQIGSLRHIQRALSIYPDNDEASHALRDF